MAEPVGVTLAVVAFFDPVYNRTRILCNGYQCMQAYGVDFNESITRLGSQRELFDKSLAKYEVYLTGIPAGPRRIDNSLRTRIGEQVEALARVFDNCDKIVRKYDVESKKAEILGIETEAGNHEQNTAPSQSPGSGGRHDQPDNRFKKPQEHSQALQSAQTTGSPDAVTTAAGSNEKDERDRLNATQLQLSPRERRLKREVDAQKNTKIVDRLKWADHGKDDFEANIKKLDDMNSELERLLPGLETENLIWTLRGNGPPPELWSQSDRLRQDVHDLEWALKDREGSDTNLTFAIRLENNHDDVLRWMSAYGLLDGLLLRQNSPSFFRLMALPQGRQPDCNATAEHIMAGTVSTHEEGTGIKDVFQGIEDAKKTSSDVLKEPFQEIGFISLDTARTFHLRRVLEPQGVSWVKEQTVADVLESGLHEHLRVGLAETIALAHIHFTNSVPVFTARQMKDFRFFKRSTDEAVDRTAAYLDNFSLPPARRAIPWESMSNEKIDRALELGILLYQITSGQALTYDPSAAGLAQIRDEAVKSLNKVLDTCGMFVKNIVELCLCQDRPPRRDQRDPASVIVEEAAYALQWQMKQLRQATERDAQLIARILAHESLAATPSGEPQREQQVQRSLPAVTESVSDASPPLPNQDVKKDPEVPPPSVPSLLRTESAKAIPNGGFQTLTSMIASK
ncbi:hypothetical protein F4778DRAFT_783701 [Xylariomycetidae sp. FL2044]|nr:hypothetical protein F4778DRAFT_783701 [Xylariomycetidae sp. FL2044]